MKLRDLGPNTPDVSIAKGVKMWVEQREVFFASFLTSAMAATAPASLVALISYEGEKVSGHVASHTSNLILFQSLVTAEVNSTNYLMQRLAVAVQRGKSAAVWALWVPRHLCMTLPDSTYLSLFHFLSLFILFIFF